MISITPDGQIIALVSLVLAVMSSLVRKATVDIAKVKELKEEMKEHQKNAKEAQKSGNAKKALKAQEDMSKLMMEQMKHNMRPMIFTFIPFILIFHLLRDHYGPMGTLMTFPLHMNFIVFQINGGLDWLGIYFLSSMISSIVLNKLMKLS